MIILGLNETSHDASVSLIEDGEILFAGHAERYSKRKNDWYTNPGLISDALSYGKPDFVAYYEKPLLKASRLRLKGGLGHWRPKYDLGDIPTRYFSHHRSHASAGYFTSGFSDAVIVVLDAIGEWNTSTVWKGSGTEISLVHKQNYPFSFGLFYSAFTQLVGLKPNEEEYIMMGMAAYGDPYKYLAKVDGYFPTTNHQRYNYHRGIHDWGLVTEQDRFDIAAAVQQVYTSRLIEFMRMAKKLTASRNLVFMGGCALNCSANTRLWELFEDVWIMPNPGDAGSSLGAAAALYGQQLNWEGPYLGHKIEGTYPVDKIVNKLMNDGIAAVASGRAEYGPRALGNRSILANPKDKNIKDKVNLIKKRELFRPFAPVVMEEYASEWFDLEFPSPYMQYAVKCKRPDLIPAVVHEDGTSRVQTVNRRQHSGLYRVLEKWKQFSGVPVLLNTSLNIKGQPLLNDLNDVELWEKTYGTTIIR